jgi:hypothetical protein
MSTRRHLTLLLISATLASGCSAGTQDSASPATDSSTTVASNEPTWVTSSSWDAFSAPVAQTACDALRELGSGDGSYKQRAEFWYATDGLRRLIGSPSDESYSPTYVELLNALENQASTAGSRAIALSNCNKANMVPENSRFGAGVNTGKYSDTTPGPSENLSDLFSILCRNKKPTKPFNLSESTTRWSSGDIDSMTCEDGNLYLSLISFPSPMTRKWWWHTTEEDMKSVSSTLRRLQTDATICGKEWMVSGLAVGNEYVARVKKVASSLKNAGFTLVKCSD